MLFVASATMLIAAARTSAGVEPFTFNTQPADQPPAADDPFAKGHTDFTFTAAYTQPTFLDRHRFVTGMLGVDYAPIKRFTVGLELAGDWMEAPYSTGAGGGFNVRVRLELLKVVGISVFADASAGILESDHPVPFDGTHFNFIETAGVGAEAPIDKRLRLMGGVHYLHISNADISVNPGYNGVQFYAGLLLPL